MCRSPAACPLCPSSCVSTATQGRLATRTEDLSPCPPPGALHSLTAAQWPPPSCGDGHGPVGLQGARASPSRSSSWSRSTCAPGCRRRHRSCVYLQPPPREELSVRSGGGGEGQGQSPPATSHQPWTHVALQNGADALGEGVRAVSGLDSPGMGWDTFLLQRAVQIRVLSRPYVSWGVA